MKRIIALLLVAVFSCGVLVACDVAAADEVETVADTVTLTVETTTALPEISTLKVPEGYAFRGYYTEPNGAGSRVLSADYTVGSTVYAYCTKTVEPYDVRFVAFGAYSYQHDTEEDENGNTYEIGYRGTEEDFYFMKEFGIDLVSLDAYRAPAFPAAWERDFLNNLAWAQQYNFEYMVSDDEVKDETKSPETIRSIADYYADNPLFFGFGIADEPGYGALPGLRRIIDALVAAYPNSENHINYISYGLLNSRSGLRDYYKYAYTYIQNHHMATDPYPYDAARPDYIGYNYYNEIATIAECARDGGKQLWLYTQTVSDSEDPYDRMRFNCLADAAYGCTGFVQFCYATPHDDVGVQDGIVSASLFDRLGNRTPAWYVYRDAVTDMRPMLEVMAGYRWQYGGTVLGDDTTHNYEAITNTNEYYKATVSSREEYEKYGSFVTEIKAQYGIVACAFEDVNGSGAGLFLLNSTVMTEDLYCDVALKVPDALSATLYYNTVAQEFFADEDGYFNVSVPSADGVFLTFKFDN